VEAAPATPAAPPPPVEMTPSPEELAAIAAREAEAERAAREAERAALLPGCEASPDATDDYANGRIPESALCALPSGDLLRADAAFAFASMNAAFNEAFGEDICVGNTYRSYSEQVSLHSQKPSMTAEPGTSNHGWGTAVDLCGDGASFGTSVYKWLIANGPDYGWDNPDWARAGGSRPEPWHWEFEGAS
jgi:hypothetical protein